MMQGDTAGGDLTGTYPNPTLDTVELINASTYTVSGTNIFVSTFSSTALQGFRIYASSGAIAANATVSITLPNVTQIWFPLVSELEGVNTAATSIRIKDIFISSYTIYNADVLNNKNYLTWAFGK